MAAEVVVSFVVGKLGDLLIEEALLLHGVCDQIKWIETELEQMRSFLKDADTKQMKDARIKTWVAQIRAISYETEDVIDTFISKVARERRKGFVGLLKRYNCIFTKLVIHQKVGRQIQWIKGQIDHISSNREKYGIKDINEETSTNQNLHDRRRNFALLEESDVVGFEEYRKNLKEQLVNGDSRRAVISIVAMGGSGKTTLTKKVYNDVKNHFDCHAFIYLSQQYEIKDILIRIIQCVMRSEEEEEVERTKEYDLVKKLSDYLSVKRYLVVIDDIWTMEAWNALKLVLPDGLNKSRVMLSTRNKEVALHADPLSQPYELRLLHDRESWELFLKKVFPQGSPCPSELEETGRQILKKCGRLPIAIVVLGGLLSRREATLNAWTRVLESVTWHLSESSDNCMEILALSYNDLPHYLKPCFLYLGLLPEDFEIKSKRLIRLWIAEGFIQQRGNEILEDVAEDYLEELIGRSMLQVASKSCNGSVRTCLIHDLLRDLSISEAKQNNFFEIVNGVDTVSSLTSKCRRLAVHRDIGKSFETLYHSTTALRSLLCFGHSQLHLMKLFGKSGKLLRVFDEEDGSNLGMNISKEMGEFVHLRYLSFKEKFVKVVPSSILNLHKLPSAISNLHNLQTLKLGPYSCSDLPNAIWDLERLRHLHAYGCEVKGQPRLNNLRNLQTLCLEASCWIEDGLDGLTNLRKLGMTGNIGSYSKSLSRSIEKLCSLRSLTIASNSSVVPFMSLECHLHLYKMYLCGTFEKLPAFPPTLGKLTLLNSRLQKDDITELEKLPKLWILNLRDDWTCSNEWICFSPGFPQLETLRVNCRDLKEFIVEEGAMPCLKTMDLHRTENLKTDPTKKISLSRSQSGNVHEIMSMAPTVMGKDNTSQYSEEDVAAAHVTTRTLP